MLRLVALTGETVAEIKHRMHNFWSWVDDFVGPDAQVGLSLEEIARMFGGDVAFWASLFDEKIVWLARNSRAEICIPKWKLRFGSGARARRNAARRQARKRKRDSEFQEKNRVTKVSRSQRDENVTTGQDRTGQDLNGAGARERQGAPDDFRSREIDWEQAKLLANWALLELEFRAGSVNDRDRETILVGAAAEQLVPRVFADSVAATKQAYKGPNRPRKAKCAYLTGCMAGKLRDLSIKPADVLGAIKVPANIRPKKVPAEASA
ncbi:MAG: hypothetical protein AB7U76_25835 [Pirellulales bacterium]